MFLGKNKLRWLFTDEIGKISTENKKSNMENKKDSKIRIKDKS